MVVVVRQARFPVDLEAVRHLFTLYVEWLDLDLSFQGFEQELANLPGKYAKPRGAVVLAEEVERDGRPGHAIGWVAIRPLQLRAEDDDRQRRCCEMKRLFVREEARGTGAGRLLARAAISSAIEMDYETMYLDTLPTMRSAIALYESLGFERCMAYYDTPIEGTVFLRLDLAQAEQSHTGIQ